MRPKGCTNTSARGPIGPRTCASAAFRLHKSSYSLLFGLNYFIISGTRTHRAAAACATFVVITLLDRDEGGEEHGGNEVGVTNNYGGKPTAQSLQAAAMITHILIMLLLSDCLGYLNKHI